MAKKIRVGVQLTPQHTTFASFAAAAQQAEALGVDTIFDWDHFYPLSGDPHGSHFDGWSLLTAIAAQTKRAEVGCLVTCNTYRNPNLLADMARTVDHISNGRLILGIGAGWFERDYQEYGYEFGTPATRLKALGESLRIITERWKVLIPPPTRPIPILIGGGGEKVTLRLTAQYATIWNGFGPAERYEQKNAILNDWCAKVGRDPQEIERSITINPGDLNDLNAYVAAGATHFILSLGDPWQMELAEQLVAWRDQQNRA